MKMFRHSLLAAALLLGSGALAHPTDRLFENRGECERAYAESSKFDRERLVDVLGFFDSYGAAQRTFNETFKCRYDDEEDAWVIVFIGGL